MPLDFAFRLHSEIGSKTTGAKVNGKMVKLNTPLKNGDVVEIITTKTQKPNTDWLTKVISKHARQKMSSFLRKQE